MFNGSHILLLRIRAKPNRASISKETVRFFWTLKLGIGAGKEKINFTKNELFAKENRMVFDEIVGWINRC